MRPSDAKIPESPQYPAGERRGRSESWGGRDRREAAERRLKEMKLRLDGIPSTKDQNFRHDLVYLHSQPLIYNGQFLNSIWCTIVDPIYFSASLGGTYVTGICFKYGANFRSRRTDI